MTLRRWIEQNLGALRDQTEQQAAALATTALGRSVGINELAETWADVVAWRTLDKADRQLNSPTHTFHSSPPSPARRQHGTRERFHR